MLCLNLGPDWACFGPSHFVGIEPPTLLHGDSCPHSGWTSRAVVSRPQAMFWTRGCWLLDLGPGWAGFGPFHFFGIEPPTLLHGDFGPHSGWTSRAVVSRPQAMFWTRGCWLMDCCSLSTVNHKPNSLQLQVAGRRMGGTRVAGIPAGSFTRMIARALKGECGAWRIDEGQVVTRMAGST